MNTFKKMPAYIDGTLLHIAIALADAKISKKVFADESAVWEFATGAKKANLRNLATKQLQSLSTELDKFGSNSTEIAFHKNELFEIEPFLHKNLLEGDSAPLDSAQARYQPAYESNRFGQVAFPFYLGNGCFVTLKDLDERGRLINPDSLIHFGEFCFTKQAVLCSAYWYSLLETRTLPLINLGQQWKMASQLTAQQKWEFCKDVCTWGGRAGLASNLDKHKNARQKLFDWLNESALTTNTVQAITKGVSIAGLGISFASKHLRFISPRSHATFDALLSQVINQPLTPEGYGKFIDLLTSIRALHQLQDDIATIEFGLFSLTKHFFDASAVLATGKKNTTSGAFTSISPEALARDFDQLEDFSPTVALYRRHKNLSLYGVAKQVDFEKGRQRLALALVASPSDQTANSLIKPDLFSVASASLRTDSALTYLDWLLQSSHQQHIDPDFIEDAVPSRRVLRQASTVQ
jgi:hypothetical protein